MILKFQKPIDFINDCNCLVDWIELEKAIKWFAKRPVCRAKHVYMHGKYAAISIYEQKIHVHRLLGMYWMNRELERDEYVHHKNGNRFDNRKENLQIMWASEHQSITNKGRIFTDSHKEKISKANTKRNGMKIKKRVAMSNLNNFILSGWSINKIAKFYGCDWSTVKNRIYENKDLLEGKGSPSKSTE